MIQKPPAKYLGDTSLAARFSVSRSTIWRWVRDDQFPKPIKLGGSTRWPEVAVLAWEAEQAAKGVTV
jgi:prophage regulatory protein